MQIDITEKAAKAKILFRIGADPSPQGDGSYSLFNGKRCRIEYSPEIHERKFQKEKVFRFGENPSLKNDEMETGMVLICGSVLTNLVLPAQIAKELISIGNGRLIVVEQSQYRWFVNKVDVSEYFNRFDRLTGERYWFQPNIATPIMDECLFCGNKLRAACQPIYYIESTALNSEFWQGYYHTYQIGLIMENVDIGPPGDIYGQACEECAWLSPQERTLKIACYLELLRQEQKRLPVYWLGNEGELGHKLEKIKWKISFLEQIIG